MKNVFYKIYLWSLVVLGAMTVSSCSDDEDISAYDTGYLGEWYLDWSTPSKTMWVNITYRSDGTFDLSEIMSSVREEVNFNENFTSTYHKDGDDLVGLYKWTEGERTIHEKIAYNDKYTLTLISSDDGSEQTFSRVIDTYYLKVGDTVPFTTNNPDFASPSYECSQDKIVSVTSDGQITALKRGKAFVTARSSAGAVTIKVIVVDEGTKFQSFESYLGYDKKQIVDVLGKDFVKTTDNQVFIYYPGDGEIQKLLVYFTSREKVRYINSYYWDASFVQEAFNIFSSKFEMMQDNGTYSGVFSDISGTYPFMTETNLGELGVYYARVLVDFENIDEYIKGTADDIAAQFGHEITDKDWGLVDIDIENGNMYDSMIMSYDEETRLPQYVRFKCKPGYTLEEVESMIKEFYPVYLEGLGYCEKEDWWNLNPAIFVKVEVNKKGIVQITYNRF